MILWYSMLLFQRQRRGMSLAQGVSPGTIVSKGKNSLSQREREALRVPIHTLSTNRTMRKICFRVNNYKYSLLRS